MIFDEIGISRDNIYKTLEPPPDQFIHGCYFQFRGYVLECFGIICHWEKEKDRQERS
jgi:hypothetical protein